MNSRVTRYTKAEALRLLNACGAERRPCCFLLSYSGEANIVQSMDEAAEKGFFMDMPGWRNTETWSRKVGGRKAELLEFTREAVSRKRYREAFQWIQEQILYGNSFLLNLTFPTRVSCNLDLEQIFMQSVAPFRLLLEDELVVFSPERFIRIRDGQVSSNPMKGTIDAALPGAHARLSSDRKEDAEHNTIVDLIRNDLSMIAQEVRVKRFKYIERVRTHGGELLQMSSEITGKLSPDYASRLGELIFSMLPAGSISGAPKRKTIEIIQRAEGYDRGYFTGVFGYWDGEELDSAVAIRYMERENGAYLFKSGGGITFQSKWEEEYEEMLRKVYVPIF